MTFVLRSAESRCSCGVSHSQASALKLTTANSHCGLQGSATTLQVTMMETFPNVIAAIKTESAAYTMVDVKFESGGASQELISQFVKSEEELDNPNKRKRSVPKKLSVEEEERTYVEEEEMEELDMSDVVKVEYGDMPEEAEEDISEEGEESLLIMRANNQRVNCKQREDCPVCGDKANGLHYGIYSCEGCKNFFKRSVVIVQNKPYVCSNHNSCDVRIVYDKSGIKRKGARCQACRYTACQDAGMSHPGFPRSRGGRHSLYRPDRSAGPAGKVSLYKDPGEEIPEIDTESSWDNSSSTSEINSSTWDSLNDQLSTTADTILESYNRDELEKERSINRELRSRLQEKETQLKISERQNEKIKRQMMTANTLVRIQQEQIKRLKLDISRLAEPHLHNGDQGS